MSAVSVTLRRTLGRARSRYFVAFARAAFLGAVFVSFVRSLSAGSAGDLGLGVTWTLAVSPWLPVLAAILGMDAWSDERTSGRLEALLSAPVRERDLVLGKVLGVFVQTLFTLLGSLLCCLGTLALFSPGSVGLSTPVGPFVTGLVFLLLQDLLWCSVTVMASALTRQAASAACTSLLLTVVLPRGIWEGLKAWWPAGPAAFGEMPFDAQALDFASGEIAFGTVAAYLVLAAVASFVAAKAVAYGRLAGCGSRLLRFSTVFASVLALLFGAVTAALALRVDPTVDVFATAGGLKSSGRLRGLLAETDGQLTVTGFLSRKDPRFREVDRCLRTLRREAEASGGVRVHVRFVDPNWDLAAAERLLARGAKPSSLVFERGRRTVTVGLGEGLDERILLSAFRRIVMPPQRRSVCWTFGHGEAPLDDYGPFGLSDIARETARAGFRNVRLDLAADAPIPSDCALVVVAGARNDFSRLELGRLESHLRLGGRLLVLSDASGQGGVASLLPAWGVRPLVRPLVGTRTLTGTDVLVSEFSTHPIAVSLAGSQLVLDRPVTYLPSVAAEGAAGADRLDYSPLATVDGAAVAAAVERGGGTGSDLALRPTRLVAVGDATFVQNGFLGGRANANRDFFMNCVSYLAGIETLSAGGDGRNALQPVLDRATTGRMVLAGVFVVPGLVLLTLFVLVRRRRNRS